MWVKKNNPALNATKVATAIDIAWCAGIWEGEGSCRLTNRRSLCCTVVQKDTEILFRLREWFGGSVRLQGTKSGCHVWEVCGDRVRIFFGLIHPFLSMRRKAQVAATNALEYLGNDSPEGLSQSQLQERLIAFYDADRKKKWSSPEFWRTEEFRKRNRENTRRYRATKKSEPQVPSIQ